MSTNDTEAAQTVLFQVFTVAFSSFCSCCTDVNSFTRCTHLFSFSTAAQLCSFKCSKSTFLFSACSFSWELKSSVSFSVMQTFLLWLWSFPLPISRLASYRLQTTGSWRAAGFYGNLRLREPAGVCGLSGVLWLVWNRVNHWWALHLPNAQPCFATNLMVSFPSGPELWRRSTG